METFKCPICDKSTEDEDDFYCCIYCGAESCADCAGKCGCEDEADVDEDGPFRNPYKVSK